MSHLPGITQIELIIAPAALVGRIDILLGNPFENVVRAEKIRQSVSCTARNIPILSRAYGRLVLSTVLIFILGVVAEVKTGLIDMITAYFRDVVTHGVEVHVVAVGSDRPDVGCAKIAVRSERAAPESWSSTGKFAA